MYCSSKKRPKKRQQSYFSLQKYMDRIRYYPSNQLMTFFYHTSFCTKLGGSLASQVGTSVLNYPLLRLSMKNYIMLWIINRKHVKGLLRPRLFYLLDYRFLPQNVSKM
jgi:hypothetical protein